MHLLLIRHGETEHNVASVLAGVTDSRLTNHGYLQAECLGKALAETRGLCFTHIFASTLQRAWMTADAVRKHQSRLCRQDNANGSGSGSVPQVSQSELLLEQDFGSLELAKWSSDAVRRKFYRADDPDSPTPGFKPRETAEAMKWRADTFIDRSLLPLLVTEAETDNAVVAVVSHGLFLQQLWRSLCSRLRVGSVTLGPEAIVPSSSAAAAAHQHQASVADPPWWTNTTYLECTIRAPPQPQPQPQPHIDLDTPIPNPNTSQSPADVLLHSHVHVLAMNRSDHLKNLKRDGVGSSPYDRKQQSIKAFFAQSSVK